MMARFSPFSAPPIFRCKGVTQRKYIMTVIIREVDLSSRSAGQPKPPTTSQSKQPKQGAPGVKIEEKDLSKRKK